MVTDSIIDVETRIGMQQKKKTGKVRIGKGENEIGSS